MTLSSSPAVSTIHRKSNKICYFYHPEIGNYHYGSGHPMKPHRIRLTDDLINAYGINQYLDHVIPVAPQSKAITKFHANDYVEFLQTITSDNIEDFSDQLSRFNVGVDCPLFDGLWEFCQLYSGASIGGAQQLISGSYQYAINWAGGLHHGKKHEASGFCYINDCVLAALEFLRHFHRIVYLDIDVHHGDGVEEAFYTSNRVMCVSFHKYGDFFPGTGALEDLGAQAGRGYSVNIPLKDGIDDVTYDDIFRKVMDLVLAQYQPEAIILQGGADSLSGDRLGGFNLTLKGHSTAMRYLCNRGIPILALGGGGYTLRNVPRAWTNESAIMAGLVLDNEIPESAYYRSFYAPKHLLEIIPSNTKNLNTRSRMDEILARVTENFREYVFPVGVQIRASSDRTHPSDPMEQLYRQIEDSDLDPDMHYDQPDPGDSDTTYYSHNPRN